MKVENNVQIFLSPTAVAAMLTSLARNLKRPLLNKILRRPLVDLASFLTGMSEELFSLGFPEETGAELVRYLTETLKLESALLFISVAPPHLALLAGAGPRAPEFRDQFLRGELTVPAGGARRQIREIRQVSDSLLAANLDAPGRSIGYLLLGPKKGSEIFIQEEKRLLAAALPLISLAVHKSLQFEELRAANQRLVKAEDRERARIVADLHDGPLQKAALFTRKLGLPPEEQISVARQLVAELREIGSRLRPSILNDLGIAASLDWLLAETRRRFGIETSLMLDGVAEGARFSPDLELALFRIAQEATNNAVKHAQCRRLTVTLRLEAAGLGLTVADDGRGFDPAEKSRNGFGLSGMRERAAQLDGSLEIRSAPGRGAAIAAFFPGVSGPTP